MQYSRGGRIRRFIILVAFVVASFAFDNRAAGIGAPAGAPGFAGAAGGGAAGAGGVYYNPGSNGATYSPIMLLGSGNYGIAMPGMYPYQPPTATQYYLGIAANLFGPFMQLCSGLMPSDKSRANATDGLDAAEKAVDTAPPEPISGLSDRDNEQYGNYGTSHLAARGGTCQKFYDKDFHLSGWGMAIREHMKEYPKAFTEIVPRDIDSLCPSFKLMSPAQREAFWVEFFAALATPESQCNAQQENHNAPNGTAQGLFQLFGPQCPHTDATNLLDPYKNIDCAVGKFAHELESRQSIMTDSRRSPTYWGTLRTNPAAVDAGAASTFKNEVHGFPGCQPTQVSRSE